jgi:hypothetical protein
MFRNDKELVDSWKVPDLFEELSSLDNDVENSFGEITNFPLKIKHSNLSTTSFTISTKLSQIISAKIQKISITPNLGRQ